MSSSNSSEFPTLHSLSVGMLLDNFLPGATPYADINIELARLLVRTRNLHTVAHVQFVSDTTARLWKIEDWDSINEIRESKRKERAELRDNNIILSDKFKEVKSRLTSLLGEAAAQPFTAALFTAKNNEARRAMAAVMGVDISDVEHLFEEGANRAEAYEVVVNYKGKSVKLW